LTVNETINSAKVEQLIDWWSLDEPPEWASSTHLFFDKLASALRRVGPDGVQFLKTQAEADGSTRKKYLAISSLASRKIADDEVVGYILTAFRNDDPGWKEAALHWLISIKHFTLKRSEVEQLLSAGGELQAAAMLYLSRAYPAESAYILSDGLRNADKWVRGTAATEAGFGNLRELRAQVAGLLEDEDRYVARSAQIGIEMFDLKAQYPEEWPSINDD
jgi:hypothetical protein